MHRLLPVLLIGPSLAAVEEHCALRLLLGTYAGIHRVSYVREDDVKVPDRLLTNSIGRGVEFDFVHTNPSPSMISTYHQGGVAVRYARGEDETGQPIHMAGGGLLFGGGICIQPHPQFQIELGPNITLGYSNETSEESNGQNRRRKTSWLYLSGDVRAGAWWTIEQVHIGGVVGVATQLQSTRDHGDSSMNQPWLDTTMTGSGGFAMVGIGCRF